MLATERWLATAGICLTFVVMLVACGPQAPSADRSGVTLSTADMTAQAAAPTSFEDPVVFAFIPSREQGDAGANAARFTSRVSNTTGLVIEPRVAESNAEVVEWLCSGQVHAAVLNTAYIVARERGCADVALAAMRNGLPISTGQIIARANSGIAEVADLAGHTFCRESRFSASSWVIPALLMRASGVDPDNSLGEIYDTGAHTEVVRAIYRGECDAGATYVDAREALQTDATDVMDRVIVVARTEPIPNEVIVFHPNIPDDVRQRLVDTLLAETEDEAGAEVLKALYNWDSLIAVDDTLFDVFDGLLSSPGVEAEDFLGD